jgi:hypothetical protein
MEVPRRVLAVPQVMAAARLFYAGILPADM